YQQPTGGSGPRHHRAQTELISALDDPRKVVLGWSPLPIQKLLSGAQFHLQPRQIGTGRGRQGSRSRRGRYFRRKRDRQRLGCSLQPFNTFLNVLITQISTELPIQ